MSDAITDTGGNPILYVNLSLSENSDSVVVAVLIPAKAGMKLTTDVNASASVMARLTGSGATFVDIAASPIDLTPWAGTTVGFDLKVHSNAAASLARLAMPVRVAFS